MSFKNILDLWFSLVLLGAGTSGAEELTGILGESVTFQVKISPPFEAIAWNKIVNANSRNIALVRFEPCSIVFFHPEFQRRVNISRDCRELHLSRLKKEDAGRYTAEIVLSASKLVRESFDLKVFRRLLDSEMKVTCTGVGNGTWKLNCSTGTWEDGVKFSWPSDVQSKNPPLGNLAIFTSHDPNLKVTCAAENLVSNASTTVSLKEVCAGKAAKGSSGLPLWALLCLSKVGSLLLLGSSGLILRVKSRKAAGRGRLTDSQRSPPPSDPTDRGLR